MQPLARLVPRLFFDSPTFAAASRAIRRANRPSLRPSICLECKIRIQTRRYADSPKTSLHSSPAQSGPSQNSEATPLESDSLPSSTTSEDVSTDLPSAEEGRRSATNKRLSHLMDNLQSNIFIASQRLNDLTGYSGIEALKTRITSLELRVQEAQEAVRSSRVFYKTTVADRAATQREVTTLLARKDTWTPSDLERFTALYRMDHSNEQAVQEAATRLADAEREAETAASKLSSNILSRYHEEQIWSDKIRRMSTWGTWGLMGVNVLLFLVFQFGSEPWRRKKLVSGFEEKVKEALEKERLEQLDRDASQKGVELPMQAVVASGEQSSELAVNGIAAHIRWEQKETATLDTEVIHFPRTWAQFKKPELWTAAAQDLFSERLVQLRKQDVTVIALEGAAMGASVVAIVAALIYRHT